jgi:hypothetical protein
MVERTLLAIGVALVVSSTPAWAQLHGTGIASFGEETGVVALASPEPASAATALVERARPAVARPTALTLKRPKALSMLYVSLGVTQALDLVTTTGALHAGAREQNPVLAHFAGHSGAMVAYKAAVTAGTIIAVERMWKKNRAAAVATAVAANVVTALVAAHNMRVTRALRTR